MCSISGGWRLWRWLWKPLRNRLWNGCLYKSYTGDLRKGRTVSNSRENSPFYVKVVTNKRTTFKVLRKASQLLVYSLQPAAIFLEKKNKTKKQQRNICWYYDVSLLWAVELFCTRFYIDAHIWSNIFFLSFRQIRCCIFILLHVSCPWTLR